MFVFDEVSVTIGIVLLVVALLSPLTNVLMLKLRRGDGDKDCVVADNICAADNAARADIDSEEVGKNGNIRWPGISIVLTVDDEIEELRNNLPKWLQQRYNGEFQIVVVTTGNNEAVDNFLKHIGSDTRLYTTFIPCSSRYMSRRKLAITVGVKAARHEWILLTDVDCSPNSVSCLEKMAGHCTESTDMVLGYTQMHTESKGVRIFDHTYLLYNQLASAQHGKAWAYAGANMMFRKKLFINGKGFDGNLKFLRGEYDFLLNKFATPTNIAVALNDDACVTEDELTDKGWRNKNLYFLSTMRNLSRVAIHKCLVGLTLIVMVLFNVVSICIIVLSALDEKYLLTAISAFTLVLSWILRMVVLAKTLRKYTSGMSPFKMFWYEQTLPLRKLKRYVSYRLTDKYDFITHKI